MDDTGPTATPVDRLAALAAAVSALRLEVEQLRAERAAPVAPAPSAHPRTPPESRPSATPWTPPAPRVASTRPRTESLDFERIVGRYGTIAVATIAILLGVGAFLQWAIARQLLGPEVRVALGAVVALVLAGLGVRLRRRGSARFGNMLLAIALAVLHLVAWAAGPNLHLVSSVAALAFAAATSAALAALAVVEQEEFLFAIGVGGALLAPFVTSEGTGSIPTLLVYGFIVSTAAIAVIRVPAWGSSRFLLSAFVGAYVAAAFDGFGPTALPADLRMPSVFVLAVALSAIVLGEPAGRRALTRGLLSLMVISLLAGGSRSGAQWDLVILSLFGTLALHALRRRGEVTPEGGAVTAFDVVLLPLAFLLAAVLALDAPASTEGALVSGIWVALAGLFVVVAPESQRGWHLTVLWTALELAILLGFHDRVVPLVLASAALAAAVSVTLERLKKLELLIPLGLALAAATWRSNDLLSSRAAYEYTPFLTLASLAALGTVVAWSAFSRLAPAALFGDRTTADTWSGRPEVALVQSAGAIAFLLWGREELGHAYSRDLSTFLLISFYAASGVAAIGIGRARALPGLRQAGLLLALFAAGKAVLQTSDLGSIGLRVGSYLVVGVFLLGVGYWYRATATDRSQPA